MSALQPQAASSSWTGLVNVNSWSTRIQTSPYTPAGSFRDAKNSTTTTCVRLTALPSPPTDDCHSASNWNDAGIYVEILGGRHDISIHRRRPPPSFWPPSGLQTQPFTWTIFSFIRSLEEHERHPRSPFDLLQRDGIPINPANGIIRAPTITFLGYKLSAEGYQPLEQRTILLQDSQPP
jgi:hypothetical protein